MKKEDKELLLKDICARSPYGVKVRVKNNEREREWYGVSGYDITVTADNISKLVGSNFMPYLRPLSSMTEEERKESREWLMLSFDREGNRYFDGFGNVSADDILKGIDWLNSHHFDYRGLINNGLALEAPEGIYIFVDKEQH